MIQHFLRTLLLMAIIFGAMQSPAFAYDVKFINYSGYKVNSICIFDGNTWHKVCDSVYDGKSTSFYFSKISSSESLWDIQVNFSNGKSVNLPRIDLYTYRKVILCQNANSSSGFCLYVEKY